MMHPDELSDAAIRLAAVEAASRRLGPTPQATADLHVGPNEAAEIIISTAEKLVEYIKTGRTYWS